MAINDLISNIKSHIIEAPDADSVVIPDDLSELDDTLPADPPPSRRTKAPKAVKAPPPKVSAGVKRQVADSVKLLLLVPSGAWAMRDEHCGTIAMSIVDDVTDAAVPIICRNPEMLKFFSEGTAWMEWLRLATALAPLGRAVWSHHIAGTVADQETEDVDYAQYAAPSLV